MKISGNTVDEQGRPIVGVKVAIRAGTTEIATVNSGDDGRFEWTTNTDYSGSRLSALASKGGFDHAEQTFAAEGDPEFTLRLKKIPAPPAPPPPPWGKIALGAVALVVLLLLLVQWIHGGSGGTPAGAHIQLPELTKHSLSQATKTLEGFQLKWTVVNKVASPGLDPETVWDVSPPVGTLVTQGQTIVLTVDPGVPVPKVLRVLVTEAETQVKNAGLVPVVTRANATPRLAPNTVWRLDPAPGTTVKAGTQVKIVAEPALRLPLPLPVDRLPLRNPP